MDTTRWRDGSGFAVLDLVARFRFKTAASVSFLLGTEGVEVPRPGMDEPRVVGRGRVFAVVGWLDAHHPCDGPHRLQLRVGLPDRYVCWESMRDLVPQVKAALGLPATESYRVYLASLSQQTAMEEPQSGLVCTKRWQIPADPGAAADQPRD